MVLTKYWVMAKKFDGFPKLSDFKIVEEELPELKEGEFLCEAVWLSVDPYNRFASQKCEKSRIKAKVLTKKTRLSAFANNMKDGDPMIGLQAAKVIESKNPAYKVGAHVVGHFGWRSHTIADNRVNPNEYPQVVPYLVPDVSEKVGAIPLSAFVGILGMPGMTAFFGVTEILKPKPGDVFLVNAAAGAVGSAVGQIAKIMGCKVIGYAGDEEKCAWLREIGFDHVFNYKTVDLDETLKAAAPNGVDCFFDNVGGEFAVAVYNHMRKNGRVCQCGAISDYNSRGPMLVHNPFFTFIYKQIRLHGFLVSEYYHLYPDGIQRMAELIGHGKLKFRETIFQGFDQMPQALIDQMHGKNIGKVVVMA